MKASILAVSAAILGLLLSTARTGLPQDATLPSKLTVHVHYSGAGTVDQRHKIYVVLWDSPDFVKGGSMVPIASLSTSSKNGVVTFRDVKKTPAYASAAYDPNGQWDAQSPPPEGSSFWAYTARLPARPHLSI